MARSPSINIAVLGIETALTLTAAPQSGNSPLPVGMNGYLQQKGTVAGGVGRAAGERAEYHIRPRR